MVMKHIAIAACLWIAACERGQDEPTAYEDMNFAQRHAFMSEVVMPQMKETFVEFDAKYESMSCATCHGDGASDGSFAMPSPQLPLIPATEEEFLEYLEDPEHLRWSEFMGERVWPEMAELLEVPVYDPKTAPDGFSCTHCHMVEGQL
ncbi:hypothetical protein SAMN02745121_09175 [Nannocystis exedens]|uniref:Cytochrome c domain-containing protein n=1 Tax=Nannocystis exedens TaxID=54 RepID=A0A1I2J9J2_9BACT|nr:hypothetical protein [Nannocystis exedens]PCC68705.1 hypothetical protein NAEX_01722 [Nannocystis exedens]SFF49371.1 hypothetical protein SAMN02745121_09175 [Nannocystis exedens]